MTDLKHLFSVSVHRRLNDADTEHAVTSTWLGVQCCVGNLPSLLTYTTQQWSMMANIWGTAHSPGDKKRCMLMTSKQTGVVAMLMKSKQQVNFHSLLTYTSVTSRRTFSKLSHWNHMVQNLHSTNQESSYSVTFWNLFFIFNQWSVSLCLQCFDAVGWAAGRASGL